MSFKTTILSKSRASLSGGVIGDCIGQLFEGSENVNPIELREHVAKVDNKQYKKQLEYTDDTAMARQVAVSLIEKNGFDKTDMARRFTEEYFREPKRGYGGSVGAVFTALNEEGYLDPYGPASRQFDGSGSYGNGSAMRIAPAAVFGHRMEIESFDEMIKGISQITHSHQNAINGAILLAAAIRIALTMDQSKKFNQEAFLDDLYEHMNRHEVKTESKSDSPPAKKKAARRLSDEKHKPYCYKLTQIKEFLSREKEVSRDEIVEELGNDISALGSVPAAIFSFLKAQNPIADIERESPFERTIMYAISLGGDTDTVATMAGALAGAYYGMNEIYHAWQLACEGAMDAIEFATKMVQLNYPDEES